jgi:pimeloyl-ACP methyl ester carboxylesterase
LSPSISCDSRLVATTRRVIAAQRSPVILVGHSYGGVVITQAGNDPSEAKFMADSQVPWGLEALNGAVTEAAWRNKPSWYLIATDDKMIPPAAQEFMSKRAGSTVAQTRGSHAVYVSQPQAVAALIEKAATAVRTAR